MVEIICTHVRNGKLRPLETIPGIEGGGIKEKDGGGKSRYIINTYMTITVYPLYNYNMLIIKIKKHTKAKIK
jgi:hypothetical protein